MARKKTARVEKIQSPPTPRQADIARVLIDCNEVSISQVKVLLVETLEPLGLEKDELVKLITKVDQIGVKTRDAGIGQLLSLYK